MQKSALDQRLALLKSFIQGPGVNSTMSQPRFASGQLTVIDLSDPFIDAAAAASLFEIVMRMFVRADTQGGKIIVVDEAHKVITVIPIFIQKQLTHPSLSIPSTCLRRHPGLQNVLSRSLESNDTSECGSLWVLRVCVFTTAVDTQLEAHAYMQNPP